MTIFPTQKCDQFCIQISATYINCGRSESSAWLQELITPFSVHCYCTSRKYYYESCTSCILIFILKYVTEIIYIVVRHFMMFYASRITFCIVVLRHCMMCHAFDDSTLYCVLFHLPHFYFCGCGAHHSTWCVARTPPILVLTMAKTSKFHPGSPNPSNKRIMATRKKKKVDGNDGVTRTLPTISTRSSWKDPPEQEPKSTEIGMGNGNWTDKSR